MGIKGLLLFLKDYYIKTELDELKNKKIGIDGYVWLHKGIYANCLDIVDNKEDLTPEWVKAVESIQNSKF